MATDETPAPQPPKPVTQIAVNESLRMVRVDLVFNPDDPDCLIKALGQMQVADDVVKQYFAAWKQGFVQLVKPPNGNGRGVWPWKKR